MPHELIQLGTSSRTFETPSASAFRSHFTMPVRVFETLPSPKQHSNETIISRTSQPQTGPRARVLLCENRFDNTPRRGDQICDGLFVEVLIITRIPRIDGLAQHARSPNISSKLVLTTSHISSMHARQGASSCRSKRRSISSVDAMTPAKTDNKNRLTCDNAYLTRKDTQKLLTMKRQLSNSKNRLMLERTPTPAINRQKN